MINTFFSIDLQPGNKFQKTTEKQQSVEFVIKEAQTHTSGFLRKKLTIVIYQDISSLL